MPRRHRKMKGGYLGEQTVNSLSQSVSGLWDKPKNALSSTPTAYGTSAPSYGTTTTPSYGTTPPAYGTTSSGYGGKRRTKKHNGKRGGGVASNAASISSIRTAQPHNLVGGRRTRRHRHRKLCKHNNHSKSCKQCKY